MYGRGVRRKEREDGVQQADSHLRPGKCVTLRAVILGQSYDFYNATSVGTKTCHHGSVTQCTDNNPEHILLWFLALRYLNF